MCQALKNLAEIKTLCYLNGWQEGLMAERKFCLGKYLNERHTRVETETLRAKSRKEECSPARLTKRRDIYFASVRAGKGCSLCYMTV